MLVHRIFSFQRNVGSFLAFVDGITTPDGVGGDTAEDVFGGLEAVTKLSWREIGTKVCELNHNTL